MLKIEIFPENVQIETRTIPAKEGKPPRNIYEQVAYAHLGGKFPVEMKLQLEEGQPAYVAGLYTVHPSSFVINQFGSLELKRFGLLLDPIDEK
ncbi:TPA: single-stranded DNA-binding protein [Vibrio parahaemolyticus]|uniref:single-stranded DNA-binding protein n=1 Tax=Vibrio harveyi group TaxID=717610 RepID=UPI00111F90E2|nr:MULTISPECIES: single-stranded DNA-binding protein [Vibrio harveyi group]ELB2198184.1 G5P family DNA-binding protein [Vibrio parahaemolyticus]MBT0110563.1 G5P family DNA-binding protein [Vibrio alginolyticus]MBT0110569.1 G5P family DNA-binding protein [Vibrio alginolyticus]MDF4694883.1 single-stranded DNA-binding protein [Vibrio parahaemolyticus]MDF4694888.1 single-stranded DNA-binding protein [Vibrio parahaemolyticus]